jgi:hypothetical protein
MKDFLYIKTAPTAVLWQCCGYGFIESGSESGYGSGPDPAFHVNPNTDPGFWWPKITKNNI